MVTVTTVVEVPTPCPPHQMPTVDLLPSRAAHRGALGWRRWCHMRDTGGLGGGSRGVFCVLRRGGSARQGRPRWGLVKDKRSTSCSCPRARRRGAAVPAQPWPLRLRAPAAAARSPPSPGTAGGARAPCHRPGTGAQPRHGGGVRRGDGRRGFGVAPVELGPKGSRSHAPTETPSFVTFVAKGQPGGQSWATTPPPPGFRCWIAGF